MSGTCGPPGLEPRVNPYGLACASPPVPRCCVVHSPTLTRFCPLPAELADAPPAAESHSQVQGASARFGIPAEVPQVSWSPWGQTRVGWLQDAVRSVPWAVPRGAGGFTCVLCDLPQAHDRPVPHKRGPDCRVTSADGLTGTPNTHCGTPPELRAEAPRAESLHPQPCQAVV